MAVKILTSSHKKDAVKSRKLKEPVGIMLGLAFILLLAFTITPVARFIEHRIIIDSAHRMANQLIGYKLPEQTDMVEEIYYSLDSSESICVYLVLKSDLTQEQVSEYYKDINIKPMSGEDTIRVSVQARQMDELKGLLAVAEDLGNSSGAVRKFITDSPRKDYYGVFLWEEQK